MGSIILFSIAYSFGNLALSSFNALRSSTIFPFIGFSEYCISPLCLRKSICPIASGGTSIALFFGFSGCCPTVCVAGGAGFNKVANLLFSSCNLFISSRPISSAHWAPSRICSADRPSIDR